MRIPRGVSLRRYLKTRPEFFRRGLFWRRWYWRLVDVYEAEDSHTRFALYDRRGCANGPFKTRGAAWVDYTKHTEKEA